MRNRGDEAILFFDLDNYIGTEITHRGEMPEDAPCAAGVAAREESEETRGIFFGADDEEEPQKVEDTEEMERRLRALAEAERRTFGTPVFEHGGDIRLPAIDDEGEWDVMVKARPLGEDYRVDETVIGALQEELLEALIAREEAEEMKQTGGE